MKSEDFFTDPATLAVADQVDAYYAAALADSVATMIRRMRAGQESTISVEALLMYRDLDPGNNETFSAAEIKHLCFQHAAAMLQLGMLSYELMLEAGMGDILDES